MNQTQQVDQAVAAIRRRWRGSPRAGLILGTGLGNLAGQIQTDAVIAYRDIPHFPCSTALSHKGQLVCGRLANVPVVTMEGRCHVYEGYALNDLTIPVRVMRRLGVDLLIISNASGGLNPQFATGDVMVIQDHIDLLWRNPSMDGGGEVPLRPTHQVTSLYDMALIERSLEIARQQNFVAHRGVYVAVSGPNYETRAEYRFMRHIGGDVVGMSTVPEASAARSCGMRVLALSIVTNVARPDVPQIVQAADVVAAAERAEPHLGKIVLGILADLRSMDTFQPPKIPLAASP